MAATSAWIVAVFWHGHASTTIGRGSAASDRFRPGPRPAYAFVGCTRRLTHAPPTLHPRLTHHAVPTARQSRLIDNDDRGPEQCTPRFPNPTLSPCWTRPTPRPCVSGAALRLPRTDLDDLRQDLLLDLIRRLPAFDARRGSIGAFAGIILRNQASRIATRLRRERRATGGDLLSLDAAGATGGRWPTGSPRRTGSPPGTATASALSTRRIVRIDLARALGALEARDLTLCAAMAQCPIRGLVGRGLGSRATLYRRLRNLRCVLAAHGARAA